MRKLSILAFFCLLIIAVLASKIVTDSNESAFREHSLKIQSVDQFISLAEEDLSFLSKDMDDYLAEISKDGRFGAAINALESFVVNHKNSAVIALRALQDGHHGRFLKHQDVAIEHALQFLIQASMLEFESNDLDRLRNRLSSLCPIVDKMVAKMVECNSHSRKYPDANLKTYFFFEDWDKKNYGERFQGVMKIIQEG